MNVVNFNRDFETFFNHSWQSHLEGKAKARFIAEALSSPLFEHVDGSEDWQKKDYSHCFVGGIPILPFPMVRVHAMASYDMKDAPDVQMTVDFIVVSETFEGQEVLQLFAIFRKFKGVDGNFEPEPIVFAMMMVENLAEIVGTAYHLKGGPFANRHELIGEFTLNGRIQIPSRSQEAGFAPGSLMEEMVSKFCIDCMNPALHMIKSHPNATGRSVEWLRPRTHYILLHKARVDHVRKAKSGADESQSPASLQRISHSRRAHDRTLRSAKFKNMQGHVIRIRSAWIGPKEWQDSTGQIYKFIERPNITIKPNAIESQPHPAPPNTALASG